MKPKDFLLSLCTIINEGKIGDSSFSLAKYFLEHLSDIPTLNIYQVADECNVSRASVRRFARSIGFANFFDMKRKILSNFNQPETVEDGNYREQLTQKIIAMTRELNKRMDTTEVTQICQRIHLAKSLTILTGSDTFSAALDFQLKLIKKGKISFILSDTNLDDEIIATFSQRDYLIIISLSGVLADSLNSIIRELNCTKDLITMNRQTNFSSLYDHVYFLSHTDHSNDQDSVYLSYGMHYFLDIIQNNY